MAAAFAKAAEDRAATPGEAATQVDVAEARAATQAIAAEERAAARQAEWQGQMMQMHGDFKRGLDGLCIIWKQRSPR